MIYCLKGYGHSCWATAKNQSLVTNSGIAAVRLLIIVYLRSCLYSAVVHACTICVRHALSIFSGCLTRPVGLMRVRNHGTAPHAGPRFNSMISKMEVRNPLRLLGWLRTCYGYDRCVHTCCFQDSQQNVFIFSGDCGTYRSVTAIALNKHGQFLSVMKNFVNCKKCKKEAQEEKFNVY